MADKPVAPVESVAEANKAGVEALQLTGSEMRQRQSNIDMWRDRFAKMPKVRVRTTEDAFVQVNGYSFRIKARTPVMVPELVAEILEQSGRY